MDEKQDADEGMVMNAADWQARASHIRQVLAGAPDTAVAEALGTFLFGDDVGNTWTYNGAAWMSWDGTKWSEGTVPTTVRMQPFLHEAEMAEASSDSSPVAAATADASAAPEIATGESALTASSAMTTESPSSDMAEAEPAPAASMTSTSEPEAEAEKEADEEPAMAVSSMSTPSMSDTAAPTTELAADKAEAAWSSTTPTADKPAMADAAAGSASTADIMSQPAAASASSSTWQPQSSSMADSTAGAASTPVSTASVGSAASAGSAAAASSATPAASAGAFKATHTVPAPGLGAWTKPDPSVRPEYQLAARTELMVVEMTSSGWARVAGSNGWTGWVDGRQLQPIMAAASQPVQQSWQQPAPQPQPAQQSWQQPAAQPQPAQQSWQQPATQPQPAQQSWQQPQAQSQPAQQSWQQPTQPAAQAQQFRPTHTVPQMGMPAWAQPNPQLPPQANLAAGTQLTVAEWSQSGWARVVASNGWSGWVDGRMLVAVGQNPYQR